MGGKLGGFGGPPRYGGILGVMGPLNGGILGTMYPSEQKARAAVLTYLSRQQRRSAGDIQTLHIRSNTVCIEQREAGNSTRGLVHTINSAKLSVRSK